MKDTTTSRHGVKTELRLQLISDRHVVYCHYHYHFRADLPY